MKKKVGFLLDKKNNWMLDYLKKYDFKKLKKNYLFHITFNKTEIKKFDIVFIVNYTKIISPQYFSKGLNVLIHESKLPKDRGFAPVQNSILRGSNIIFLSLIEATSKVDAGDIFMKSSFKLEGTELNNEIRLKQAEASLKMMYSFLKKYPNLKREKQKGKSTFNKMRKPKDSKINIHKSIKSQMNLLRICDNERYPAFFIYKKKKFILKIFS